MEKNAKVSIQYDAFVKAVRPDSKATESTVFLEGFIGESSLADHFRLYSDASLNDFVEIPTSAVVHAIANSKEESTLGGSKIWVKKDAMFTYGNPAMDNRPQGSFLDGDLYQGYMENVYQPQADASGMDAGQGDFMQQTINPVICGGTIPPITINPAVCGGGITNQVFCPPKKSLLFPCITNPNFPPCKKPPMTSPLFPPCNGLITIVKTCNIICKIPKTTIQIFCGTIGNGPIQSIADCPSFPCPPGGIDTRVINPNPNVGGGMGGMSDQFNGDFNPYFDGDLNKAYMENMYQPQADAGMGNMGGGMENMAPTALCGTGVASIACSPVSRLVVCNPASQVVICNPISRIVICFTRTPWQCFTRNGRISICNVCPPWTWNKTTTIWNTGPIGTGGPVFNPGNIGGGFGQMGGDFDGSFNPYNGY